MDSFHGGHRCGELFGRTSRSVLFLLIALSASAAWGQVTASITGKVEDPSGAAVPGATVTVKNVETSSTRTVTTDATGNYRVLSLAVGRYEVRAEKPGFKTAVRSGIGLSVAQEAVVGLSLEVGDVVQEVSVSAEAPLVNTTTATVSGLVSERQVKDLPLNGRSFDNLITLNPGTVNYSAMKTGGTNGTGAGNYFSVAGRRPLENLFLLNGIEYTGSSSIGITPGGVSGQLLGIDAVREFNVVSDAYSAQYGKRAGGQISIVTQSGSNSFHGSAFEFLRNSKLDARNFFDQGPIAPFKRNQFGGSAGGPLRKDKLFVFGNYEGFRQRLGISDLTLVPDENARRGLLPVNGVPTPVANVNPAMLPFFSFWPLPNGRNLGAGIAESFSNPKQSIREDFATMRADQTLSAKDTLSEAYTIDDGSNLTPQVDPLFATVTNLRSQVVSLQETHVFSPQMVNTAQIGFSRGSFLYDTPPLVSFAPGLSFFSGKEPGALVIGGSTATSASSITAAGSTNTPDIHNARNLFTYDERVQIVKGNHQISTGVWFQRLQSNADTASQKTGRAVFGSLTTFLQGTVGTFSGAPNPSALSWRSLEGAWFVEDSMKVRPNFTLRMGLRHEFTDGYNERYGRAGNFITDANGVLLTNPHVGTSPFLENNAKKLFSPRIGIAWDVFGNGKTAVRSGFGIYYTLLDDLDFHLDSTPPANGIVSFLNVSLPSILPITPGVPVPPVCGPNVPLPCTTYAPEGVQANMKTPAAVEWNFTIEQELTRSTALRVAYVGSHSYHNLINQDLNAIPAQICANASGCPSGGINAATGSVRQGAQYIPVGTRPNRFQSNAFMWMSNGNSSYNSLQLELTRRLAQGLQFRGNYTWSKNLDMGSGLSSSQSANQAQQMLNRFEPKRDWGPSAMDNRNHISAVTSYELPFGAGKHWMSGAGGVGQKLVSGWQVNAIVTLQNGFPFTAQVGSNRSGDGNSRNPDRPDLVPGASINPSSGVTAGCTLGGVAVPAGQKLSTQVHWFDPCAFALPTSGTYGNLGRETLVGPGLAEVDLSFFKNTKLSEKFNLQFRAELFNLSNRSNFGTPNPVVFQGTAYSTSAGLITSTATTSRQIQFGLKLIF